MPFWARLIVALAVTRVVAALAVYAAGASTVATRAIPLWVHAALAATFAVTGLALALGHQNDRRAAWLGGVLTLVGCPLAMPLVPAGAALGWLLPVRPDAFLGAFAWTFVACFPTDLEGPRARAVNGVVAAATLTGAYLFGASLLALLSSAETSFPAVMVGVARQPVVFYWPMLLVVTVSAFFALLLRARVAEGSARRRVQVFVFALLAGLGPIAVEVLLEGIWPRYQDIVHSPGVEPWVGAVIFAALATLPLTTAYSVLFDRVVSVRLVLRKALQHGLARYTILALTLIPFGGLAMFVAAHPDESLRTLIAQGGRPTVLIGLVLAGMLALRLRPRLLAALDRRYFREPFDGARILERLMARSPASVGELGSCVGEEIGAAFHAAAGVFLIDETRTVLIDPEERSQPLSAMTPLLNLAPPPDRLLDVAAPGAQAAIATLPEHERKWLAAGGYSLIGVIHSHQLGPVGLIALAPKLSELPYAEADRRLLAAVTSAAGLAFDRLHVRATPVAAGSERAAVECGRCFTVYASGRHCVCGGELVEAPVPYVLRGVFRFEQRIAAGSLGVVYRAVDLGLGRAVAIKTLSGIAGQRMAVIVEEARAMAGISHPNLAVVHSVETWRDVALLVQEYLENGTLARRLFRGRLDVAEALDLAVTLGELLIPLHRRGLVHCDIKPSNIGYTAEHVVKLFDFGLARRVEAHTGSPAPSSPAGTPFYMSPEAISGEAVSAGFDLWALSVVLYEAVAGRRPFDGATTPEVLGAILHGRYRRLSDVAPDVPERVAAFFDTALSRDRAARPGTAEAFVGALREVRQSVRTRAVDEVKV